MKFRVVPAPIAALFACLLALACPRRPAAAEFRIESLEPQGRITWSGASTPTTPS